MTLHTVYIPVLLGLLFNLTSPGVYSVYGQETSEYRIGPDTGSHHVLAVERAGQERCAMQLLLGWGSVNVLAGSAAALNGPTRDFGLMTAGWGAVNAAIAGFALAGADPVPPNISYEETLREEMLFNRILAINSGLNAGYIATGFAMNQLGNSSRIRQFGTAVVIQGAFLIGFDAWLLWNSSNRLGKLAAVPIAQQFQSPEGNSIMIQGVSVSVVF